MTRFTGLGSQEKQTPFYCRAASVRLAESSEIWQDSRNEPKFFLFKDLLPEEVFPQL
jgi:hypothetical protein